MHIIPFGKRLIIKTLEEDKKVGNLVLPDSAERESKCQGEVIDSNVDKIKKCDIVLYGEFSGDDIKIEDKEFKILKQDDVLAILKKE